MKKIKSRVRPFALLLACVLLTAMVFQPGWSWKPISRDWNAGIVRNTSSRPVESFVFQVRPNPYALASVQKDAPEGQHRIGLSRTEAAPEALPLLNGKRPFRPGGSHVFDDGQVQLRQVCFLWYIQKQDGL